MSFRPVRSRMGSTLLSASLFVLLAATASAAHAAPPKPGARPAAPAPAAAPPAAPVEPALADSLTGDAKTDYEAGKVYFNDKDYTRAYLKFESAYQKSKDARLLWNMAACQKEQRKYAKVVPLIELYIKERGDKLSAADREISDGLLAAIKPGVTLVKVDVSEPDADIYLDDELIGKSPMTVPTLVELGPHKLRVKKAPYDDFEQQMNAGNESMTVPEYSRTIASCTMVSSKCVS